MAHPRRRAGLLLALCHWRACQQQSLRDPRLDPRSIFAPFSLAKTNGACPLGAWRRPQDARAASLGPAQQSAQHPRVLGGFSGANPPPSPLHHPLLDPNLTPPVVDYVWDAGTVGSSRYGELASVRGIMKYQSLNELTSENRWCSRANEREREKLRTAGLPERTRTEVLL